jgi:flagellar assembly protein FliH
MQDIDSMTDQENLPVATEHLIKEAKRKAEAILSEAKTTAESLKGELHKEKMDWEQEKIQLYHQVKEDGFKEGFSEGKNRGYEEMLEQIEQARQLIESSKKDYRNKVESAEQTILTLGLQVAEKIIGERLESNPEHFLPIVKRALKEAREYREIQLHVNPVHYDLLVDQKEELMKIFPKQVELYIYPDADLSGDSCVIESANGRIDASVDQQLEVIKNKLFELLESE